MIAGWKEKKECDKNNWSLKMKNKMTSRSQSKSIYSKTEAIVKKKVGRGRDEEERDSDGYESKK